MDSTPLFLITIGALLLAGLGISALGRRTLLPRVTLLLLFGAIIGRHGLDLIPGIFTEQFELVADMTLLMVGFLLGEKLTFHYLRKAMGRILWISVGASVTATLLVILGLLWFGVEKDIAILLGCIAAATAPAAVLDVTQESGRKGPFRDLLLSVVAIDDAWALILFALGMAVVSSWNGLTTENAALWLALRDIGCALLLGLVIGLPAAYLTGRLRPGQPILSEALGVVFVCGGLAIWLDVSFLIAAMVLGAVVANFAKHHEYPFHEIENIEWLFMVIFFVLAGASLDLRVLAETGLVGMIYIVCRILGKLVGARIGADCAGAERNIKRWIGPAMLPQAGVSIGMALVAANQFPQYRQILLTVVISSTIFFEIIGPIFTRMAIRKAEPSSA